MRKNFRGCSENDEPLSAGRVEYLEQMCASISANPFGSRI